MTVRYVGPGGSDAANGLTWATRKLTLNGVEDTPVVAGDTVYVGPGVYRESLTVDVSGSSGNIITYIGDVTGAQTDGVGGVVRITGTDNDQTATRNNAVVGVTKTFRTFRGFLMNGCSQYPLAALTTCTNWIVEDCVALENGFGFLFDGNPSTITVRRCVILSGASSSGNVYLNDATTLRSNAACLVENCILLYGAAGVNNNRIGGVTVRNNLIMFATTYGITSGFELTAGQTYVANNNILAYNATAFNGPAAQTTFTENYNALYGNTTDRTNVASGANSIACLPLFLAPPLYAGRVLPWQFGVLSQWSLLGARTGTGEASDGFYGMTRPATSSKKSWGAIQYQPLARETTTVDTGSAAYKLADASRVQLVIPAVPASAITVSCKVYREADYAGTAPQLVLKQPGQSDVTVTDAGSAGAWNTLSQAITPAATPNYLIAELVSNNTATSGAYATYFDTLKAE